MHNNIQQTTFWNFLKKRKIEIPIIQRDYAQGRIGKEKLREKFLTDIKKALDGNFPNNEVSLKLDFVYGSVENNCLNPLDGQQRLTTLWLLHWFIAHKAEVLQDNKEIFKKFTYETRTTSREFCNKLSDFDIIDKNRNIVGLIQNQTWFFSAWKQDPTIQAMLNMLGGTPIKDEKENEIIDGIEEVFCDDLNFIEYWQKLTNDNCPIIFYYLDLLDLTLSDDLYIKMNARGKPLTNFENYKADLVGYVDEKRFKSDVKKPEETVAHKLDTIWTDIFWKSKSSKHKIDEIYFAFFNRYFLNKIITAKDVSAKDIESNKMFKYLYGKSGDDTNIQYNGFYVYKSDAKLQGYVQSVEKVLDAFHSTFKYVDKYDTNKLFYPSWDESSDFRFIPWYEKREKKEVPTGLTQPQRVVFYAISCYFEKNAYQEPSFKQWMRVVWNIVENANIDTIQAMIGAMRLIDDLGEYSHKIYEHLKDRDVSKDFAKGQMEEEKEKASLIKKKTDWENSFIKAEKHPFFKGCVSFLISDGLSLQEFDHRYSSASIVFSKNGVEEEFRGDGHIFLRALISRFTDKSIIGNHFIDLDEKEHYLKKLLANNETVRNATREWFSLPIDDLKDKLIQETEKDSQIPGWAENNDCEKIRITRAHEALYKYPQLQNWMQEKGRIRFSWASNHLYISRPRSWYDWIQLESIRNELIHQLVNQGFTTDAENISGTFFYKGGNNIELYGKIQSSEIKITFDYLSTVKIENRVSTNEWTNIKEYNYVQEDEKLLDFLSKEKLEELLK